MELLGGCTSGRLFVLHWAHTHVHVGVTKNTKNGQKTGKGMLGGSCSRG